MSHYIVIARKTNAAFELVAQFDDQDLAIFEAEDQGLDDHWELIKAIRLADDHPTTIEYAIERENVALRGTSFAATAKAVWDTIQTPCYA